MAVDDNVEEKKIAKLDFEVEKALNSLLRVQKQVTYLDELSEKSFKNIGKNFSSSFKVDSVKISSSGIEKQLANINKLSQSKAESLKAQLIKIENKKNAELEVLDRKRLNKIEERNQQEFKSTETLGDKIANYAKTYLIYQGFNALKNEAKELVNEMVNVESQMVQIDRVLNDSSLNIDDYRDKLINLAYEYGNSFENVADITLRLAQAGYDADVALALTEKTLLALNTAELNATQATDDMVAVMAQWGLITNDATKDAEAYGDIIDKINIAADNFPTTSEDIMNALKKTSSAFNIAGADIDETIALIVAAEKASQRGGKAIGTALSNISQQLKETSRIDIAEDLGISFFTDETKSEYKDLTTILSELSNKMQQLKDEGKESSVEMQQLLSVFTVFRRNIGSSLLGEMDGEDSTYQQVLDLLDSQERMGYSLRENAKYMNTVEAAQKQFNNTLLELKTNVWDAGVEDVFRGLLVFGNDAANVINNLVENFGLLPTSIGAVVLAYSSLNKQWKANVEFDPLKGFSVNATGKIIDNIKKAELEVNNFQKALKSANVSNLQMSDSFKTFVNNVEPAQINTKNYTSYLVKMKAATIAAQAATIALNAALSLGLSAGISLIISGIDKLIHLEENRIKKIQEEVDAINENIKSYQDEKENIDELINSYNKLNNIEPGVRTAEQQSELQNTQNEITNKLKQQGKYVEELNGKYEEQADILKDISDEQLSSMISEYDILLDKYTELNKKLTGDDLQEGFLGIPGLFKTGKIVSQKEEAGIDESLNDIFNLETVDEQIKSLAKWQKQLKKAKDEGKEVGDAYAWVNETLSTLRENNQRVTETQSKLNELTEEQKNILSDDEGIEGQAQYTYDYVDALTDEVDTLEELQQKYEYLTSAVTEYNNNGKITVATFKNIAENNLWQYLDIVNGKLKINEAELNNAANQAKEKAKADLQAQAAAQILSIVQDDLNVKLEGSEEAGIKSAQGSQTAAQSCLQATKSFLAGTIAAEQYNAALKGQGLDITGISDKAKKEIDNVLSQFKAATKTIDSVVLTSAKSTSRGATKTFEEQSQERVKIFKQEIDDLESLEKAWVNKYKKLELFSTNDLKFITHQRINRYNQYLNEINALTGISEKDRADLIKEYSSKRQEAELEYFDLLKTQLEEQIDALEEANDAKIKLIEDEADAQIAALKKVEDENDRIKQKQEYEAKRNELLYGDQGIEYWSQRTGAEAKKALLEAQKELEELDEEWNEKKEEWTLEEQIEEIENARDAQIKAIEDAQETQIKAWQAAYDEQVRLYAETGQIIYDNSIINAEYLYNAYMDNFVSPLNSRLREISSAITAADNAATAVGNKVNQIKDDANSINSPKKTYSTIPDVQTLNQQVAEIVVKERFDHKMGTGLYNRKNVGMFHDGGIVGGSREALALLKPNEVVLKPDWAAGLNKLVARINQGENIVNNTSNSTNVVVEGNMVNIEADIKKSSDIKELSKEIEDVLKKKLNINK